MTEATKTPIEPGVIAQIAAGIRYTFTGQAPSWFGPQQPLAPVVPETEKPSVEGRQFDFPVGFNIQTKPRSGEAVTFQQMRNLADSYDLLRLVIETRKDQLAKMKWNIKPKEENTKPDERCATLQRFFASPDKENDWNTWLRLLLEDLFVLDAPTIYVRKTLGGDVYAFEAIDGATIKRVIDNRGRTPLPPEPAYQQILKGVPAANYTKEELIYRPRNPRTHKVYGYSPVEQIIMTVNIALRRQLNQLSYYTEGNTPNLIFGVPETWNVDQIKQFQLWWDTLNAGESKHVAKFVPGGTVPHDTKPATLKDEMEEWLARIVCYAFSVSAQPFVKENNRATAQTAQEAALGEGLAPLMEWIKGLIDHIITIHFGFDDLEFAWSDEEAIKPLDQANIDKIYVDAKIDHPDEIRARRGLPPLTAEQKADMSPPPPPQLGALGDDAADDGLNPPQPDGKPPAPKEKPEADKVAKAKKALRQINRERSAVVKARTAITQSITDHFKAQAPIVAGQIAELIAGMAKADNSMESDLLGQLLFNWGDLFEKVKPALKDASTSGVTVAAKQIGGIGVDIDQANEVAIAYAEARAAEMVGMKLIDGELVENPDAQWAITDSTREMLRSTTQQAMEEGWSNDRLADEIADSYAFSDQRAEMIARTETANADVNGNLAAYRATDLVAGKIWIEGSETDCEICATNAEAGVIGLDETFPDGSDGPPGHPNCVCDVLPVLNDDESNEQE